MKNKINWLKSIRKYAPLCVLFLGLLFLSPILSFAQQSDLTNIETGIQTSLASTPTFLSSAALGFFRDWKDLFDEPEFFEDNSTVIQLGVGFFSSVDLQSKASELDQLDVTPFIPALHLIYERQIWRNFGLGMSLGTQIWKVPVLNYQYRYYTGGLRMAYHLNILDKLDPYVALGGTYRRIVLTNTDRSLAEATVSFHTVLGARYYLTDKIGGYLELGTDTTNWLKLGFSFYFS